MAGDTVEYGEPARLPNAAVKSFRSCWQEGPVLANEGLHKQQNPPNENSFPFCVIQVIGIIVTHLPSVLTLTSAGSYERDLPRDRWMRQLVHVPLSVPNALHDPAPVLLSSGHHQAGHGQATCLD